MRRLQVAEVDKRHLGRKKRASHGNGTRGRGPKRARDSQESCIRERGGERQDCGGKAVSLWKSGAGHSKGCCGAKVLGRRKASRIVFRPASFHAGGFERDLGGFHRWVSARAAAHAEGRDRGVRGTVCRVSRWDQERPSRRPVTHRSESLFREEGESPSGAARKRYDAFRELTRRECSYEET